MEMESEKKNVGILNKVLAGIKPKEHALTAEYAWLETTYGEGSYRTLPERIQSKQRQITNLIKSKFPKRDVNGKMFYHEGSYRCVVDIESDLAAHTEEIFKPYREGGFTIINLSERIEEIKKENVYLISWKNVFIGKYEKE